MWQTIVVGVIIAVVLIYTIRHYVRVFRSEVPSCSGCPGGCSCSTRPAEKDACGCPEVFPDESTR